MLVKVVLSVVPSALTAAMIAIEIPAAIKPYSIAVAPESFLKNAKTVDMQHTPTVLLPPKDSTHRG